MISCSAVIPVTELPVFGYPSRLQARLGPACRDVESVDMVSMAQRKTTTFTLRMDPEVKQASEKGAADDRRSLSSLIEILLIDYCKKRGLLTEEGRLPKKPGRK
jgi:hypothetical protein